MARTYNVNVAADTTIVTTAETVVATLTGVSVARLGEPVRLHGEFTITTGANTTGLTIRCRRDSLTGALVDEAQTDQIETAAGSTEDHDFVVTDPAPGELANATYVLTVAPVAASANATVTHASLEATVGF